MGKVIGWVVFLIFIVWALQAGFFQTVFGYFQEAANRMTKEQVIHEADGSTTTIRYKNIFDILLGR